MRRYAALLAVLLLLLCGCATKPTSPSTPATPPEGAPTKSSPAPSNTTAPAPADTRPPASPGPTDIPKASRFTQVLRNTAGQKAQIYLYAPDERQQVVDAPSCLAQAGDALYTGAYAFYLRPEQADQPQLQEVAPYGTEHLTFNGRKQQVWVVPGEAGKTPDLVMVSQYGSCNGDALAVLGLSPDRQRLVQYRFQLEDGRITDTTGFDRQLTTPGPGRLRTKIYNNATGKYTTTTWEVQEADAQLVAVQTEVQ